MTSDIPDNFGFDGCIVKGSGFCYIGHAVRGFQIIYECGELGDNYTISKIINKLNRSKNLFKKNLFI